MARKASKTTIVTEDSPESPLKLSFYSYREKIWDKKRARVKLHRSFRRSYREDYSRETKLPGVLAHLFDTLGMLRRNWRIFLPLLLVMVVLNIFLVGIMNEDTYVTFQDTIDETAENIAGGNLGAVGKAGLLLMSTVTTGGLNQNMSEVQVIFMILIFLIVWLSVIFILRHRLAGHVVRLRDALYQSLSPLISTLLVLLVVFVQLLPIGIAVVAYSAANNTGFLATPFYAFIFWLFATGLSILSLYLISSSLIGLVAVSVPGTYPMRALGTSSDLMAGRRTRFVLRLVAFILFLAVIWVLIMLPITLLDLWLKTTIGILDGLPIVPFFLAVMTFFSFIFLTAYVYLFYRRLLEND